MNKQKTLKVCVGASAGGHMSQLQKLLWRSESWPQAPSFCVTTLKSLADRLAEWGPVYVIGECNRRKPLNALGILVRCFQIAMKERPDVVVTTGSLPLAIFCFAAKLSGAKIVWIDSIANVEKMSLSGRIVRPISDLCLVQWPELVENYKGVEYKGSLI